MMSLECPSQYGSATGRVIGYFIWFEKMHKLTDRQVKVCDVARWRPGLLAIGPGGGGDEHAERHMCGLARLQDAFEC